MRIYSPHTPKGTVSHGTAHLFFFSGAGRDLFLACLGQLVLKHDYSKCPKILYTKVANKMVYANSADQDQTAPSGAV